MAEQVPGGVDDTTCLTRRPDWETCVVDGCRGEQLVGASKCWAHAPDLPRQEALDRLSESGCLSARGVTVDERLLEMILAAAPRFHPYLALNLQEIVLDGASITSSLDLSRAYVEGDVSLRGATVDGDFWLGDCSIGGSAWFDHVTIHGEASLAHGQIGRHVWMRNATVRGNLSLNDVQIGGSALLNGVMVRRSLRLQRAQMGWGAELNGAILLETDQLGPFVVNGALRVDDAQLRDGVQIVARAGRCTFLGTRFGPGTQLLLGGCDAMLDGADLSSPVLLASTPRSEQTSDGALSDDDMPRVLSLRGADVSGFDLTRVDLRSCRFASTHHLDRLRVHDCRFASVPATWWRTSRRCIAEEHHWRKEHSRRGRDWYGMTESRAFENRALAAPSAPEVASIYRDLRKSLEERKDEPGAADFYYGEMEMRRQATRRRFRNGTSPTAFGEHVVLTLYWLLSGYGLRAWRALASFTAATVGAAVLLALWGFAATDEPVQIAGVNDQGNPVYVETGDLRPSGLDELPDALRLGAQAATTLLRGTDVALTPTGEWIHLVLRLVGPILLGLAVLSVRGRVRR